MPGCPAPQRRDQQSQSGNVTVLASSATGATEASSGKHRHHQQCDDIGTVTSGGSDVGGLIGFNSGSVSGSSASDTVQGYADVGGLIGSNTTAIRTFSPPARYGGTGANAYDIAGLIGLNSGSVAGAYATGDVPGRRATPITTIMSAA